MPLKLYNTLTRKKQEFIPIKKNFLQRLLGGLRDYFGEIFR